jgi:hypothetical protein
VSTPPHHIEEEGKFFTVYLVDAEGAAELKFLSITAAYHNKLPRLGFRGQGRAVKPDKIYPGHDFVIGNNGGFSLPQSVFFLRYSGSGLAL